MKEEKGDGLGICRKETSEIMRKGLINAALAVRHEKDGAKIKKKTQIRLGLSEKEEGEEGEALRAVQVGGKDSLTAGRRRTKGSSNLQLDKEIEGTGKRKTLFEKTQRGSCSSKPRYGRQGKVISHGDKTREGD